MKKILIPIEHLYYTKNELDNYSDNVTDLTNIVSMNETYLNKQVGGFLDSILKTAHDNLEKISTKCSSQKKCNTEDYAKILMYLNYQITLLSSQFPHSELDKLKLQIDEMKNLITIK